MATSLQSIADTTPPAPEAAAMTATKLLDVVEWLSGKAPRDLDDAQLISGLGSRLRDAGLPIHRLTLHLRMLHPELVGRTVAWAPDEPPEVHNRAHGYLDTPSCLGSPLRQVMETGEDMLVR